MAHQSAVGGPPHCAGCGRNLQIRGKSPHPSERLCGWCVQRLRPGTAVVGESRAGSGSDDVTDCAPWPPDRSPSKRSALAPPARR